ncbi:MAG: N5-glutamine methyltransferase family protein [Acidimicrobiales bacterium]
MLPRHLTVARVTARLIRAGCVAAIEEAHELVAAAPHDGALETYVRRREQGEPLAWITGMARFCGHDLHVYPGVYVCRPQSEELARRAAALLAERGDGDGTGTDPHIGTGADPRADPRALDLCTGAGAIAVHMKAQAPNAAVIGVDLDLAAVRCARSNGVSTILGDLGQSLCSRVFDVVTAVAPYVPTRELAFLPVDVQRYDTRLALHGGADGLDIVREVVVSAGRLLRPGGWLLIEVGGEQDRLLAPTLAVCGFNPATSWHDEDGDLRGLVAQMKG